MKGNVAAIVLIVLGVFFLLTNLGLISISLRELLRVWWPVALIAVGVALFFTPGGATGSRIINKNILPEFCQKKFFPLFFQSPLIAI